ncbi:carboxypeptidase regulatory-like domain-containing protein [Streptomyces kunmingensis]|uniref:Carboxypeptidase regulatory-like domain-containing protein n=1 Tax=Streptomyces kunmingensis TaxID=68225 RepID=A0ABU6C2F8_9ACTN|nr:carboxypeptidase regulatory-like domain-containing protein [Streptomyces kunmingensis]
MVGDIDATRELLDEGAHDVDDTPDGTYRLPLPAGTYSFTFSGYGYGYANGSATGVTLTAQQAFSQDAALTAVASHAVSGTVLDVTGKALAGAKVELNGAPLDAVTTDARGRYSFAEVAEGAYNLTVKPAAPVLFDGVFNGGRGQLSGNVTFVSSSEAAQMRWASSAPPRRE